MIEADLRAGPSARCRTILGNTPAIGVPPQDPFRRRVVEPHDHAEIVLHRGGNHAAWGVEHVFSTEGFGVAPSDVSLDRVEAHRANGLQVAREPVAADSRGRRVLNGHRHEGLRARLPRGRDTCDC